MPEIANRTENDTLPWLRLALIPGLAPATLRAMLSRYGSPQAVLDAGRREIAAQFGEAAAALVERGPDAACLDASLAWLDSPGHYLVTLADAAYPTRLLEIASPPTIVFALGRLELLAAPAVAIVGSRNATAQGARDAQAFAQALSQAGLCIVSGMALGIDAAAHRGGLMARGSSVAVLGTGADIVYPARNRELAHALARDGCVISEFPIGTRAVAGNFPRRNRLISGLARGVLVVEAAIPSGSLVTARLALEQGRDVFAIPGSIHSPLSKGCHDLIKQGAKLVECAEDILAELGWASDAPAQPAAALPREAADPLLDAMGYAPVSLDELARTTGMSAARIARELARLEIEGRVSAIAGGRFQRVAA